MSPFAKHVEEWSSCTRCSLCDTRYKVVISRGRYPCPIVFIGEAPGKTENVKGLPFVGQAGKLLDAIIKDANALLGIHQPVVNTLGGFHYAMTNLVGCIPLEDPTTKSPEPTKISIKACAPRVVEFVHICKPRLIVLVGSLAAKNITSQAYFSIKRDHSLPWLAKDDPLRFVEIRHPAFILRNNKASQGLEIQRCTIALKNAVLDLRGDSEDLSSLPTVPPLPVDENYPEGDIPF